jgi:hypothetical protein
LIAQLWKSGRRKRKNGKKEKKSIRKRYIKLKLKSNNVAQKYKKGRNKGASSKYCCIKRDKGGKSLRGG